MLGSRDDFPYYAAQARCLRLGVGVRGRGDGGEQLLAREARVALRLLQGLDGHVPREAERHEARHLSLRDAPHLLPQLRRLVQELALLVPAEVPPDDLRRLLQLVQVALMLLRARAAHDEVQPLLGHPVSLLLQELLRQAVALALVQAHLRHAVHRHSLQPRLVRDALVQHLPPRLVADLGVVEDVLQRRRQGVRQVLLLDLHQELQGAVAVHRVVHDVRHHAEVEVREQVAHVLERLPLLACHALRVRRNVATGAAGRRLLRRLRHGVLRLPATLGLGRLPLLERLRPADQEREAPRQQPADLLVAVHLQALTHPRLREHLRVPDVEVRLRREQQAGPERRDVVARLLQLIAVPRVHAGRIPLLKRLRRDDAVAQPEVLVQLAHRVSLPLHDDRLDHTRRRELPDHVVVVAQVALLVVVRVRLHRPHEVRVRAVQLRLQRLQLLLELRPDRRLRLALRLLHHRAQQRPDELALRRVHRLAQVVLQRVHVLLPPPLRHVLHRRGVVVNAELVRVRRPRLREVLLLRAVLRPRLLREPAVRAETERALRVEERHHARLLLLQHVQARLVVRVLQDRGLDALGRALLAVHHEGVLVVVVLQRLVREVDAELLERVDLEVLEPEDVEQADVARVLRHHVLLRRDHDVQLRHQPVEHARVQRLRQRVPHVHRLRHVRHLRHDLRARLHQQRLLERVHVHLQQVRHAVHQLRVRDLRLAAVLVRHVLHVLQVQHGSEHAEDAVLLVLRQARVLERLHQVLEHLVVVRHLAVHLTDVLVALRQHLVVLRHREVAVLLLLLRRQAGEHLVEHVVATLPLVLRHDTRLLQQVVDHLRADQDPRLLVEEQLDVLTETRRVVVAQRLRVTERLEDRVRRLQLLVHALRQTLLHRVARVARRHPPEVLDQRLRRLRLTGSGLAGDQDRLVAAVHHDDLLVRLVRHLPRVRALPLALRVRAHLVHVVVVTRAERVDRDDDLTHPGVHHAVLLVPPLQAVQERGLVQVAHLEQVLESLVVRALRVRVHVRRLHLELLRPAILAHVNHNRLLLAVLLQLSDRPARRGVQVEHLVPRLVKLGLPRHCAAVNNSKCRSLFVLPCNEVQIL
eukprot:Rhum_TRINITY_DN15258_c4_g1::Rhum_TRINITY_DN15258_c4_g1_i5::g.148160::m.148160